MSIDDNWHVGIDGRAGPHREPIPEVQAHFDKLTARIAELEHRLAVIALRADRYKADPVDRNARIESWGKLDDLLLVAVALPEEKNG